MKRLTLFVLIITAFSLSSNEAGAQTYSITGFLTDTLNQTRLPDAAITLIHAEDSILENFTRTKEDGSFTIKTDSAGRYIILISFPSFVDYVELVTLTETEKNLGEIPMISRTHLLQEFVLTQQIAAIKIKGDTTEYIADSFGVRENATVEELLKKLPGLQVNKNGEVVAHGEKVQKILVDGEEFFTDDPAVVTKSLQAKAVDKVQVYDKKSDQAAFTGIDDGIREKTINLQLKDNMKKGYFGKVVAGGGTNQYYENQLMLNAFKNKRKLSVFGIAANTGKMGLGWEDRDKYTPSNNSFMSEEGYIIQTGDDGSEMTDWNGNYNGQGIPAALTGGLHYSNKWLEDRLHASSNYRYAQQNIDMTGNTLTQYNLDSFQYYNDQRKTASSTGYRHRIDALGEWKIDSLSNIKLTANAGYKNTVSKEDYSSRSIDTTGHVFNTNTRNYNSDAGTQYLNANFNYQKKFNKKGRTLAVYLNENYSHTEGESYLNSVVTTLLDTASQKIDQRKEHISENFQLSGHINYTEPLSKILFISAEYGLSVNNSSSARLSYNRNHTDGDYDLLDSIFSSNYDFNILTHKMGSTLRMVKDKITAGVGGSIGFTDFNQKDLFTQTDYNRKFTNFFPSANFTYRPSRQKSFSFYYNGSTQQPTIDQIQPLRQNTDPLNISVGNPDLKQEFNHRFNLRFNNYKIFTSTYTYAGLGFNFTNNDISRTEIISDNLIRTYQYINVDGNYNGWFYGGFGKRITKLNTRVGMNANGNYTNTHSFINNLQNISRNRSVSLGINTDYDKDSLGNIGIDFNVRYNSNDASVNQTRTRYFTYETSLDASFELPLKFEIGTEINWNIRQKVAEFDRNNNVFLWEAYLSKKFLKSNALEIRAFVYDILNQNLRFSRVAYANTITEQNYNTIQRYGMLQLIWNFTKTNMGAPQQDAKTIIIGN